MDLVFLIWRRAPGRLLVVSLISILAGLVNSALFALASNALGSGSSDAKNIGMFIGLALLVVVTNTLPDVLLSPVVRNAMSELAVDLARAVTQAPLRRLEEVGRGAIVAAFENDLPALLKAVTMVPIALCNVTIVIGCMAYLFWVSPTAFAIVFPVLAIGSGMHALGMRSIGKFWSRMRASIDGMNKSRQDLLVGIKELKLHRKRREAFVEEVFRSDTRRVRDDLIQLDRTSSIATNIGYSYTWICLGIALFAVPFLVQSSSAVRASVLVVLYTTGLLRFVADLSGSLVQANGALRKLDELQLTLSKESKLEPNTEKEKATEIAMRGVTFAYPATQEDGGSFVVGPIDMTVRPSEVVFVVGGNGSGKTTFGKLLCGLYPPSSGEILRDGRPVSKENVEAYRNLFSAIFSEFHVFDRLLAHEETDLDERATALLKKLRLSDKVRVVDGRLTTVDLSSGQRKRLALLVAMLDDRPFCLFDEWAADQDPEFRETFYREIIPELVRRGKGVIAISHDDRYFHLADRVVKLADGRIASEQNQQTPGVSDDFAVAPARRSAGAAGAE